MRQLTLEEKFAKAVIKLRTIRPFYAALYEATEKIRKDSIKTVGVTHNKLLYNKEYLEKVEFEEFLYIMLHEIVHIALMHVVRMGKRNMQLWNIACDLFVNKLLGDEFNLRPGEYNVMYSLKMGSKVYYDERLNTDTTIVEELYESINKQVESQGYFSDNDQNKVYVYSTLDGNSITFCKKDYTDIINDGSDEIKKDDENRKLLTDAKTRFEMSNNNKSCGNGTNKLEELVNKLLESKVDWKKLLRKYCVQHRSKDISFSSPDTRMYYQSAIYPGLYSENSEVLKNVKVCIDTSGSISEEDLGHFFNQIMQLVNTFNTSVDVIDWDTEVENLYTLDKKHISSKTKFKIQGRGGTDPSCLFKYFDSNKCKVKPFVTLIFTDGFIYTEFKSSWAKKYKNTIWIMTKDYNKDFNPEFGKIAHANFSK